MFGLCLYWYVVYLRVYYATLSVETPNRLSFFGVRARIFAPSVRGGAGSRTLMTRTSGLCTFLEMKKKMCVAFESL